MVEYYSQRASTPGTLLITEATHISVKAGVYAHAPGIYTDAQIKGWKKVLILFYHMAFTRADMLLYTGR